MAPGTNGAILGVLIYVLFRNHFEVESMRALILAAGRGSRMGALGDERPKCLVELDGRPLWSDRWPR